MGKNEINEFLSYLATERHVSASTQNQALGAILFLYRYVLNMEVELGNNIVRAKRSKHIPVVFTKEEARLIISNLKGVYWLIANLLYGSGLRLLECLKLMVEEYKYKVSFDKTVK